MDVKFPDGDVIHQDPRMEDRLYYYLPKGEWRNAVGVNPQYDRHAIPPHTFCFWKDHLSRLQSMSDSELLLMTERYAQFIWEQFSGNKHISFEFPDWFIARLGDQVIWQAFANAGWQLRSKETNTFQWERLGDL